MRYGVAAFITDETPRPAEIASWAEEEGLDALLVPEHSHIPVEFEKPWPHLTRSYQRLLDPLVALASAAEGTQKLMLGTGICLVPQRDPIILAKEIATLDQLSGGRVLFGVGAGWRPEELRNHGVDPATRTAVLHEKLLAMKALWTEDEASFSGDYLGFPTITQWPKPRQRPHPPLLVGGNTDTAITTSLRYGDAWMPRYEGSLASVRKQAARLGGAAAAEGRACPPLLVFGAPLDYGEAESIVGVQGVQGLIFGVDALPRKGTREVLRQVGLIVSAIRGKWREAKAINEQPLGRR